MKIAGMQVQRGTIQRGFVETAGYVDGIKLRIPVIVAHGSKPGKTLAVVAGQYGRELNGPAAIFLSRLSPSTYAIAIKAWPSASSISYVWQMLE